MRKSIQGGLIFGLWILVSLFLYPLLYRQFGVTGGAIFLLPAILTAWIFGVAGGLSSAGLIILLLFVLVPPEGQSNTPFIVRLLPGPAIAILIGLATGWTSHLFHESKTLASELALERKALVEQIALRQQAEQTLQKLNAELELRVLQRTEALKAINEDLIRESEERKEAETKLFASEERLRQLAETIDDMIWLVDLPDRLTLYVSPACEQIYGYSRELFEQNPWFWLENISPQDQERVTAAWQARFNEQVPFDEAYRIVQKDGSIKWVSTRTFLLRDQQNQIYRLAGITKDITVHKRAEELIQTSLQEKEVLLKEIHHRVKNNLQIISSLLSLAAERISDPASRQAFKESQNRVHSMALIHEKLYRSKSLAQIDFADYIHNLTSFLFHTYQDGNSCATLDLQVEDAYLSIDTAIPCGLILNELVSNALKYAFPPGEPGRICVRFSRVNAQEYCLEVADTGQGLPFDLQDQPTGSLGLVVVKTLVDQLEGRLEIDSRQGARFTIYFPDPDHPPARV